MTKMTFRVAGTHGRRGLLVAVMAMGVGACAGPRVVMGPKPPFRAVVGPVIVAHRGGSLEAPENTLAAMRHAVAVGADWLEVDVTLSRDDHVVVIHDDTLERTTNGTGLVERASVAELQALTAGSPRPTPEAQARLAAKGIVPPDFGDRYRDERVPTLEQVLAIADARLMIELKRTDRVGRLAERVVDAVRRAKAEDRVAIGSFDETLLDAVNQREPSLPLIGILDELAAVDVMLQRPVVCLAVKESLAEETLERSPPGLAVWTWTIVATERAQALAEAGIHGIITDIPSRVVEVLRRPPL